MRIAALLAIITLALSACAEDRPTVAEWEPTWEGISSAVPSESAVSADTSRDICRRALALLRSNTPGLFPTPDFAIDDTVRDWVEIAENTFFECPPRNEQVSGFSEAYAELLRLQGEIELVLEMDRDS